VRKQARVCGISGKAWQGIRLKEHDERMKELPEGEDEQRSESSLGGKHHLPSVKQRPVGKHHYTVFS
jgi:hypothetical protein